MLAVPVGTLTALAFAGPIAAYMSTQRDTSCVQLDLAVRDHAAVPVLGHVLPDRRQLPEPLQPIAWLLPLWHGVDLARALALGTVWEDPLLQLAHLVILTVMAVGGVIATFVMFRRRLER